ncbi:head-tail adaptor, putative [Roseobacter sp. SK209-2-6]|uniref:head-tail adaptor protein n=1 Tax=Roseobacter sp. SK209-2-6 TaxID=388739 RepID=UPI0000F3E819|nr:head-tail adaptor protein [Roseobacter sp. SK209-2-6]EBA16164.1 head-tail adaptor, putative [Roseobacter sp. SK209-2-6]
MSVERFHLNRKLTLETPQRLDDGSGGFQQSWVALGDCWAAFAPRQGRTEGSGGTTVSSQSFRITVRAAPPEDPSRPIAGQRFREGNRLFLIEAVREADVLARYLTCECREEVSP